MQDRVLVIHGGGLEKGILDADAVDQAAIIQDIPTNTWPDGADEALGREQVGEVLGFVAERPEQGNARIEIGGGDADAGALGRDLAFGAAEIGSAAAWTSFN